jgi:Flp pilus assembly protein TadD
MSILRSSLLAELLLSLSACSTVPIAGRTQLNLIPGQSMLSMSLQQYDQFIKEHKVSNNYEQTATVKRVGVNVQHAVECYFAPAA